MPTTSKIRIRATATAGGAGEVRWPRDRGRSRVFKLLCAACLLTVASGVCHWSVRRPARDLTVEAYVWQRRDSPELRAALDRSRSLVARFHFLGAEITRGGNGELRVARTELPAERMRGQGAVLRIGSSLAGETWQDEAAAVVERETAALLANHPAELQVDYDCPQRRLGFYQNLAERLRRRCPGTPLVITALPAWLEEPAAAGLFAACDGVVLQVHSLRLPERPEQAVSLCDPAAARAAVSRMAEFGIPFRVALNTYACEVFFDSAGRVVEVNSEDTGNAAPATAARRSAGISDAVALAGLVREWRNHPPRHLTGIVWYRLPLDSDRRNWRQVTWAKVAAGEVPRSGLQITARPVTGGAWDLVVTNYGERDEVLPEFIATGCEALVLEGLNGYTAENSSRLRLEHAPWPWLPPGTTLAAGWLRNAEPVLEPRPSAVSPP